MRMSVQNRHAVLMYLLLGENKERTQSNGEIPKNPTWESNCGSSSHPVPLPGRPACPNLSLITSSIFLFII